MSDTAARSRHPLERVFSPTSIAIVGASADPGKRGHQILRALGESGYRGRLYPVHPTGGSLMGRQVFPSVRSLPEPVDLAVLCTPAATAPGLVRECGEHGVGAALVLAVGFGESGPEGAALERDLVHAARSHGVRIIGPNTSGLLNLHAGINLIGASGIRPGGIALLVQSGNMALTLMNEVTRRSGAGISLCVGLGNQIDLGFAEVLDFLGQHEDTHAVIVYAEGFADGRRFLEVAAGITPEKPVVLLKGARSVAGARSALSHTGAVVGPYDRLAAGLAQAGVATLVRADELLHVAETLAEQPPPRPGQGIAILSDGGGQSTLAVDALAERGLELATLAPGTSERLREVLGPAAAVGNPVDLAGAADTDPRAFARALDVLVDDASVGTVLVVGLFGGYGVRFSQALTSFEIDAARDMTEVTKQRGKGLVVHTMYASHRTAPLDVLGQAGVPVIESLDVAVTCVTELERRGGRRGRSRWPSAIAPEPRSQPDVITVALAAGHEVLTEPEARALLEAFDVGFTRSRLARTNDEAAAALQEIGGPVALKVVDRRIVHKSDAGGVVLGVETAHAARGAFDRIRSAVSALGPVEHADSTQLEVLVTPMEPPPILELLVGAYRDRELGPVLTIGAGGLWIEALSDVVHRVLPVGDDEIVDAIAELRVSAIIDGARGGGAVDRRPMVRLARSVAECMLALDDVAEVELNPVFVYADRVSAIDARVVLGNRGTHRAY